MVLPYGRVLGGVGGGVYHNEVLLRDTITKL